MFINYTACLLAVTSPLLHGGPGATSAQISCANMVGSNGPLAAAKAIALSNERPSQRAWVNTQLLSYSFESLLIWERIYVCREKFLDALVALRS